MKLTKKVNRPFKLLFFKLSKFIENSANKCRKELLIFSLLLCNKVSPILAGGGDLGYHPPPDIFGDYKSIGLRLFKLFEFSN